jgi:hypothetical protein
VCRFIGSTESWGDAGDTGDTMYGNSPHPYRAVAYAARVSPGGPKERNVDWDASQWGALGSVLGGAGSVAAMGATLALLWHEISVRRKEELERRRERLSEQARQARLIYGTAGPTLNSVARATVANFSDAPVWDVEIMVSGAEYPLQMTHVDPMSTESQNLDVPSDWAVMNVSCGGPSTVSSVAVNIVFTDNAGLRWSRDGRSQPERVDVAPSDP